MGAERSVGEALPLTPADLRARFGCTPPGDALPERGPYRGVATLESAGPDDIAFFTNPRYLDAARASRAGAVLCTHEVAARLEAESGSGKAWAAAEPYVVFARVSQHFHKPSHGAPGVSPQAWVDASAILGEGVTVFPFAYVGPGARVGRGSVLYPGAFVGAASILGRDCLLYPNAVVREGCRIGDRAILNPGAVVGGDGFGFAPTGMENVKIPQSGGVTIGDDVELGSNASVDRGALDDTVIADQVKIDSLVQVGHNVRVGEASFLAAQVGIGGSCVLGKRVTLAGQVGVAGHLTIGDFTTVLAKAGVTKNLPAKGLFNGIPARPSRDYLKQMAALARLAGTTGKSASKDRGEDA